MPLPPKTYALGAEFPQAITMSPVGVVRSPHQERFGTPKQAPLAADPTQRSSETSTVQLFDTVFSPEATDDIAGFDYVWVLSWMHLNRGWRNKVNVRGDSTNRRGLLATRAPHRPNPLGLSALRLVAVDGLSLHVERCDLLDGTPVLDVKPYVPYADAFPGAEAGWVDQQSSRPER